MSMENADDMQRVRTRAARINLLMDAIPARFYMNGDDASQKLLKSAATLDPARAKSTSQLVAEAASATRTASAPSGAASKKRKAGAAPGAQRPAPVDARSREELRNKLERRIAELKEERRQKQSEADKAKAAEVRAQRGEGETKGKAKGEGKGKQAPKKGAGEGPEANKLVFEAPVSEVPFEATVGRRGAKARRIHEQLREAEATDRRLREADKEGRGEEARHDVAMRRALARARGEKVHDSSSKLRKAQNTLDKKKAKGRENWQKRVAAEKQEAEEKQATRQENLKARRAGSKKAKAKAAIDGRGFEGKHKGMLNKEEA